jgi:hypothetical protein
MTSGVMVRRTSRGEVPSTEVEMRALLWVVWVGFVAVTAWALAEVGFFGIFRSAMADPGSIQIFVDLCVACGFGCTWLVADAKAHGRNPWPWVALVLPLGSIPLITYAVLRPWLPRS